MKTINNTLNRKPILSNDEQYSLTVEFSNGARYSYTSLTKKDCIEKYKKKFGNYIGVKVKEWNVIDKYYEII